MTRTIVECRNSYRKESPVSTPCRPTATVRQISIRNYKKIDSLDLDLPVPRMNLDPDVLVIGSENGLGKTSILECCSLLLSTLTTEQKQFGIAENRPRRPIHLPDLLITAGAERLDLAGEVSLGEKKFSVSFHLSRRGTVVIRGEHLEDAQELFNAPRKNESVPEDLISAISGMSADPVVADPFLFFHSYRKVQEGNPELGMMTDDYSYRRPGYARPYQFSVSRFKISILRSLMQQADLFEPFETDNSNNEIERLNELIEIYAGGTISKLRPKADNTVEFRIHPIKGGDSFTFDGLSSGQKEIISTLFLIWRNTQKHPSVVLIDEPELHLNAQWHRSFLNRLFEMAPRNQYIVATHSADVMDSVDADRRVFLSE